jgi:HEAT repeat protein
MNAAILVCLLLLSIPSAYPAQNVYALTDFVNVNGDSLKQRYDSAVAQGRKDNTDTFWVAYEMSGRTNASHRSADGIEEFQTNRAERIGMFLLVRKSDAAIEKLRIVNLSYDVRVYDRKVYWLGKPNDDESAALLLNVARSSTSTQVKKDAVFWLGQELSQVAGDGLQNIANSDPEVEVQKQAVFAISLRRNEDSIPSLMRIAKEHPNSAVRRQAIFWLGQKRDPRVLDFFEQLLKK